MSLIAFKVYGLRKVKNEPFGLKYGNRPSQIPVSPKSRRLNFECHLDWSWFRQKNVCVWFESAKSSKISTWPRWFWPKLLIQNFSFKSLWNVLGSGVDPKASLSKGAQLWLQIFERRLQRLRGLVKKWKGIQDCGSKIKNYCRSKWFRWFLKWQNFWFSRVTDIAMSDSLLSPGFSWWPNFAWSPAALLPKRRRVAAIMITYVSHQMA